jgi:hypothetical protein
VAADPRLRDVHWLAADGVVACNPRDREAAHRAEQGDLLAVEGAGARGGAAITCRTCREAFHRAAPRR